MKCQILVEPKGKKVKHGVNEKHIKIVPVTYGSGNFSSDYIGLLLNCSAQKLNNKD